MNEKCPIVITTVNFDQFSDPKRTQWPLIIPEVHIKAQNVPIHCINLYYQTNVFISNLGGMKMSEKCLIVITLVTFDQFLHH